jgi:hypothetical protein
VLQLDNRVHNAQAQWGSGCSCGGMFTVALCTFVLYWLCCNGQDIYSIDHVDGNLTGKQLPRELYRCLFGISSLSFHGHLELITVYLSWIDQCVYWYIHYLIICVTCSSVLTRIVSCDLTSFPPSRTVHDDLWPGTKICLEGEVRRVYLGLFGFVPRIS